MNTYKANYEYNLYYRFCCNLYYITIMYWSQKFDNMIFVVIFDTIIISLYLIEVQKFNMMTVRSK